MLGCSDRRQRPRKGFDRFTTRRPTPVGSSSSVSRRRDGPNPRRHGQPWNLVQGSHPSRVPSISERFHRPPGLASESGRRTSVLRSRRNFPALLLGSAPFPPLDLIRASSESSGSRSSAGPAPDLHSPPVWARVQARLGWTSRLRAAELTCPGCQDVEHPGPTCLTDYFGCEIDKYVG